MLEPVTLRLNLVKRNENLLFLKVRVALWSNNDNLYALEHCPPVTGPVV